MNRTAFTILLAAAALSACSDNSPTPEGRLRFVNVSPDAPVLSLVLDGDTVASNIAYLGSSEYLDVPADGHVMRVADAEASTTLIDQDVTVADQTDYTVLAGDTLSSIKALVLTDNNSTPAAGTFKVRAVHAAPHAGPVDVYVTDPDADLTLATPLTTHVTFGQVLPYAQINAGTYQIRVTASDTKNVLIDSGALTVESGQVRTVIAVEAAGGGEPFNFLVLNDLD